MFSRDYLRFTASTLAFAAMVLAAPQIAFADEDDDDHGDHHGDEEHYDITLWNNNGVLQTGGWDHDTEELEVDSLRLFEAHFGEDDPLLGNSAAEPGFGGTAAATGLTLGDTMTMNLNGAFAWNGNGFSATSNVLSIGYEGQFVDSITGGGLNFLVTEDWDEHPIFSINEDAASNTYLLEMSFTVDGVGSSDPFWIAFNYGEDNEQYFESHVGWVETNLVPAPGVLALLGLGGLATRRRRA